MTLNFERGDPAAPTGHALLYFTDSSDPGKASATYVVLLPVMVDIRKYVPPFLAGQVEGISASDLSAFAFPPAPEPVESADWVRRTAQARGDDLISGGAADSRNPVLMMARTGEIVAEYRRLYTGRTAPAPGAPASVTSEGPAAPVDDVVYGLMGEADLLAELSTLVGRLRYAVEGRDTATAAETRAKVQAIGNRLPANRRIDRLVELAADTSPRASGIAQLYVERAYALFREDYLRVKTLDAQIAGLEGGPASAG
jgi:hypothetical protein